MNMTTSKFNRPATAQSAVLAPANALPIDPVALDDFARGADVRNGTAASKTQFKQTVVIDRARWTRLRALAAAGDTSAQKLFIAAFDEYAAKRGM